MGGWVWGAAPSCGGAWHGHFHDPGHFSGFGRSFQYYRYQTVFPFSFQYYSWVSSIAGIKSAAGNKSAAGAIFLLFNCYFLLILAIFGDFWRFFAMFWRFFAIFCYLFCHFLPFFAILCHFLPYFAIFCYFLLFFCYFLSFQYRWYQTVFPFSFQYYSWVSSISERSER